ncbi:hypothetical protein BJV82DRAFT_612929 [Fennellomyces sp. T-0311]|nr:hypothetical protein BJV82DRAFT_612929 [Fennellomyces sp. T-0311]
MFLPTIHPDTYLIFSRTALVLISLGHVAIRISFTLNQICTSCLVKEKNFVRKMWFFECLCIMMSFLDILLALACLDIRASHSIEVQI